MAQTYDGRLSAWLSSFKLLNEVGRVQEKDPKLPPEVYEVILDRARIYADLAKAPEDIGLAAGEALHEEYIQRELVRQQTERKMEQMFGGAADGGS